MIRDFVWFDPETMLPALEFLCEGFTGEDYARDVYEHLSGVYLEHTSFMPTPRFLIRIEV